jgi:hypothetical protein
MKFYLQVVGIAPSNLGSPVWHWLSRESGTYTSVSITPSWILWKLSENTSK